MKIYKYFLLFIGLLPLISGYAQKSDLAKANELYSAERFSEAIPLYEESIDQKKNLSASTKLANCYRMINKMDKAEKLYAKIIQNKRAKPRTYLYYGETLMSNEKYEEAKKWLTTYLELKPNNQQAATLLTACDKVKDIKAYFQNVSIIPFPYNTAVDDTSPAYWNGGIVFTSDRSTKVKLFKQKSGWTGREFLQLYYSAEKDNVYSDPKPFSGKLNALNKNTGMASFTSDNQEVFFTRNSAQLNRAKEYNMQIYQAKTAGGNKWKSVKELPFCTIDHSYMHPAISPDGEELYFVSDKPRGKGGTDLYVAYREKKGWSKPKNLGDKINTAASEGFPFIDDAGKLYFCSKGHTGFGGFDIFFTEKDEEGEWKTPVNVGKPINSSHDDISIFIKEGGKKGFFTSSRIGGDDDIYIFESHIVDSNTEMPDPLVESTIGIIEIDTIVDVKVEIIPEEQVFEEERKLERNQSETTDSISIVPLVMKEDIVLSIPLKDSLVEVPIVADTTIKEKNMVAEIIKTDTLEKGLIQEVPLKTAIGFSIDSSLTKKGGLKIKYMSDLFTDLGQSHLDSTQFYIINNIKYHKDEISLSYSAATYLDSITVLLTKYPNLQIELSGHTSNRGEADYNLVLSDRRAKAAATYITQQDIDEKRILVKGYGNLRPIRNCVPKEACTEKQHDENERLELRLLNSSQ